MSKKKANKRNIMQGLELNGNALSKSFLVCATCNPAGNSEINGGYAEKTS